MLATLGTQRLNLWRTMTHKARKKSTLRTLIKWSLNTDLKTTRCKTLYEKREIQDVNNMRVQTPIGTVWGSGHCALLLCLTPLYHFTHSFSEEFLWYGEADFPKKINTSVMTISFIIKTFTFGTMIFWEQIKCWSLLSVKESKKKMSSHFSEHSILFTVCLSGVSSIPPS